MHRYKASESAVSTLEFLANQAVAYAVEAGTVVTLNRAAEQAELSERGDQLAWKIMAFEGVAHQRSSLFLDKPGNAVLHHALIVGQFRADVEQIQRI